MKTGQRRGVIVGAIVVITLFVILLTTLFFGVRSVGKIMLFVLGFLLVLTIIGVVFWAVWYLFIKKQKFDATYQNKKKLIEAGKMCKPASLNNLYLSGDRGHTRVRLGKIIGYCRIKVMKKVIEYDKETGEPVYTVREGKKVEKAEIFEEEQDIFIVQNTGWLMSFFTEPMVVRIAPNQHDQLVGDVTIYGFSLVPISDYYFLHDDYLDVRKIDFNILKEAERGIYFEALKDTKEIVDKAVGIDSGHKKKIEEKSLYEIPQLQQGGGGQ